MAIKLLTIVSKRIKEVALGIQSSAGAGDANKIVLTGTDGKVDPTFLPTGVGAAVKLLEASETLAAGDLINVWLDGSDVKMRKADGTAVGKEAHGFVLASVTSGAEGTAYFDDELTGLTGLTPGERYYLSTTPGQITTTPGSATGNILQCVGVAVSTSSIIFEAGEPVELA